LDLSLKGMNEPNPIMDAALERQVHAMAATRMTVGAALLLVPGPVLRLWLGWEASTPFSRLMARSAGGRDLALGMGTLFALRHQAPLRGWLEAAMLADASDAGAMVLASRHLSRFRLLLGLLPALGSIAYLRTLVPQVAQPGVGPSAAPEGTENLP
jgi:hypothetical protein